MGEDVGAGEDGTSGVLEGERAGADEGVASETLAAGFSRAVSDEGRAIGLQMAIMIVDTIGHAIEIVDDWPPSGMSARFMAKNSAKDPMSVRSTWLVFERRM